MWLQKPSPVIANYQGVRVEGGEVLLKEETNARQSKLITRSNESLTDKAGMAVENATQITNVSQLFTTIQACYFSQRSCYSNIKTLYALLQKNKTAFALHDNGNTAKKPACCRSHNFCSLICDNCETIFSKTVTSRLHLKRRLLFLGFLTLLVCYEVSSSSSSFSSLVE